MDRRRDEQIAANAAVIEELPSWLLELPMATKGKTFGEHLREMNEHFPGSGGSFKAADFAALLEARPEEFS